MIGAIIVEFSQLILMKIIKIATTRCHADFKVRMHQMQFRLGLRPRPAGGA